MAESAAYLQMEGTGGSSDLDSDSEDGPRLSFCQRCGIRLLCLVLTCYFLPMLSFIPLALFGGIQMPSPWEKGYNKDAPVATIPSGEMPSGRWYWNLPLVTCILLFLPTGLVAVLYQLKMRTVRRQRMLEGLVSECA
ncbi:unnamed protein product [Symbiodinium pilosum]|uniref:Uncharacterized protein n=1 Tax=Symbiodinium pilosum TaxID=2952 RepID=A0A812TYQ2_SYMPI|nr:unnamed protein product [Symbiodinium pilosum]